jgi:hypothetical protein
MQTEAGNDANESALVKGASIFFGPDFIEVHADTGGHVSMLDREAFHVYLPGTAAIQEIIPALQKALQASHSWWPEKFIATGGWRGMSIRWNEWIAELHRLFPKKKSRATLFKGVCWLEVKVRDNSLTMIPKARVRQDGYGYIKGEHGTVTFEFELNDSSFSWEAALSKAMARCEG